MRVPARLSCRARRPRTGELAILSNPSQTASRQDAARVALDALAADPNAAGPLVRLGLAAAEAGELGRAGGLLRRAITLAPSDARALAGQGAVLAQDARTRGSGIALLRRALALEPGLAWAWAALAAALSEAGHRAEATRLRLRLAEAEPRSAEARFRLGLALQVEARHEDALAVFDQALSLGRTHLGARFGRATALQSLGQAEQAEAAYRALLRAHPDHAEAWSNLGRALRERGRVEEALDCYDRAVALRHDFPDAHWNRAIALFLLGRLPEAWEANEWRWQVPGFPSVVRNFPQPLWQGEPLEGRTLLLHAEQGLGDTLQFLRFVTLAAARGGRVVLEVQRPLLRLAASVQGVAQLVAAGDALPRFDLHAPLLSLPRALAPRLADIPASLPYLAAPEAEVVRMEALLATLPRPRVGFVWAGSPTHGNDRNRSMPADAMARLAASPGIVPVSLQMGPQAGALGGAFDLAPHLNDFASTAGALAHLDLLVTVDTSIAHLAGALGRPVSLLLPHAPDWRWMLKRTDSPWYPGMVLHRQQRPRDWSRPMAEVAARLEALVQARAA